MKAKLFKCIRCHRPLPGDRYTAPLRSHVCDLCSERVRTQKPIVVPSSKALPQPDERKSKRRKGSKSRAAAVALVAMLLPFFGCTLHHTCELDLEVKLVPAGARPPAVLTES